MYVYAIGEVGKGKYAVKKSSLRFFLRRLQRQEKTKKHFETADPNLLGRVLNKYKFLGFSNKEDGVYNFERDVFEKFITSLSKYLTYYVFLSLLIVMLS